jgi:hypothetical protein
MTRARAHNLAALPVVLLSLGLPGCGPDSPAAPTRALLTQGQMAFPRPEISPGLQPLYGMVNFATPVRGDLEVTADWSVAANSFVLSIQQGTCGVANQVGCDAILVQGTTGTRPARVTLSNAPAGSYTLIVLVTPGRGVPLFVPDTVSYQVFLTR